MKEIYPGVHAVQGKLGPRWLIQYILAGERTLLIDTGVKGSASSDIYPYMESVGLGPGSLDYVLISHADVDHFGDNATIKRDHPKAVLLCHTLDREMVESSAFILKNRYGWYEKHDLAYPEETFRWLGDVINADIPVDMTLSGGEWIHLSAGWSVQVLHLPGHTPGHLGVWDPKHEAAYISDAVMGYGLLNREGRIISPPPYFDVEGYRGSVRKLIDLNPSALYTAHYPPMKGREVNDFLAASLSFTERVEEEIVKALRESSGPLTLKAITARVNEKTGPFSEMANELAGPVRAHLKDLAARGEVMATLADGRSAWSLP